MVGEINKRRRLHTSDAVYPILQKENLPAVNRLRSNEKTILNLRKIVPSSEDRIEIASAPPHFFNDIKLCRCSL